MQDLELTLPRDRDAPTSARRAIARLCGIPARTRTDLELLVTELVTNAVRHGHGPTVEVRVEGTADGLRAEVVDDGHGFEPPGDLSLPADPYAGGGYGLRLVERMSATWGVEEGSTHVWFELAF